MGERIAQVTGGSSEPEGCHKRRCCTQLPVYPTDWGAVVHLAPPAPAMTTVFGKSSARYGTCHLLLIVSSRLSSIRCSYRKWDTGRRNLLVANLRSKMKPTQVVRLQQHTLVRGMTGMQPQYGRHQPSDRCKHVSPRISWPGAVSRSPHGRATSHISLLCRSTRLQHVKKTSDSVCKTFKILSLPSSSQPQVLSRRDQASR
jgi:hypothetical protein